MGALVVVAPVRGASAATGEPAARLRVAVAIENEQQLALPADFGPHAAARAVAQGVTEACRPNAPSAPVQSCSEIGDAPGSGVCVDETAARALSRARACDPADAPVEALDLSGVGCQDAACFEAEARRLGATHLLLVHATWTDGLQVGGTLRDLSGAPATSIRLPATYNPQRPRTGPQVLGILKWVAHSAVAGELRRIAEAPARLAVAPPPPAPLVVAPMVPAAPERRGHAVLGWTLVGAGIAAGVAGGWLLSINGQGTSCTSLAGDSDPCAKERRTLVPGVGVTVAAAAALVTGVVLLVRAGHSQDPALAAFVHPNGLLLKGWF